METLKNAIALIVGKHGEVEMPNPNSIVIHHSQGKHWFRIYPDARPGSDSVFLLCDQGGVQAVAQPKSGVIEFLIKLFSPEFPPL
jgi:hypothetical protein